MKEVVVDTEKLAFGLERGVDKINTPYIRYAPEERLRTPICELASAAIVHHARSVDVEAHLYESTPNLSFAPYMQHVVPVVNGKELEGTIIDASPKHTQV